MTGLFAAWFVLATVVVAAVEPGIAGLGDAAWFLFTVVTTIGLGDYTCATILGRVATVSLSVYSVFYLALITGAVVSFCNEVMMARRDEGAAAIVDQLEHLEELDRDELAALSARVRALTRQQH